MIFKINTKAGMAQAIDKVGNYFAVISNSSGIARVRAFDEKSRELFNSLVYSGTSVEFDFIATKVSIETETDAEVTAFLSKSKLYNSQVSLVGAGAVRARSVSVNGEVRLNTVLGQNKEIIIKAKTGSVKLSGQMDSTIGSFELEKGETIRLATSGDVFASSAPSITTVANQAPEEIDQGAFMSSKRFLKKISDKNGVLYGLPSESSALVTGIGHAAASSWASKLGVLTKWRDRLFLINRGGHYVTIYEIINGRQILFKNIRTGIATPQFAEVPYQACFSNDGSAIFATFADGKMIIDVSAGKMLSLNPWGTPYYSANTTVDAYLDGWVVSVGDLYFINKSGEVSLLASYSVNTVSENKVMVNSGCIMAFSGWGGSRLCLAYDNSLSFEVIHIGSNNATCAVLVGDTAVVVMNSQVWIKPRYQTAFTVDVSSFGTDATDAYAHINEDGTADVYWTVGTNNATGKVIKMRLGTVTGSLLPEMVEVMELF